ncbi:MAG: hypothetical protein OEY79_04665, partial [Anaplasmataceae bacterium]|nr:hypothetical protein [Anaplasmataceae bacterium]
MDIPFYMLLSKNDALVRNAEVITNNIANTETKGYKQRDLYFRSLATNNGDKRLKGTNSYPYDAYIKYDDTNGAVNYTMGKMDFMFDKPNHYFGVRTKQGIRYSRNGEFHLTREGVLVDNAGNEVVSREGAPIVIESENFEIDDQGAVYAEGLPVGIIGLFEDNGKAIKKVQGDGLYSFNILTDEGIIDEGTL